MVKSNAMSGFSRLEILLIVLMVAVIGACVFLVNRSRRQLLEQSYAARAIAGNDYDFSAGADAYSANGGAEGAGEGRGGGTNAGPGSSEFNERSLAIALPGADGGTNAAEGSISGASSTESGAKSATNALPAAFSDIEAELKRIAALPWSPETEKLLHNVLAQWAQRDPAAALAYALELEGWRAGTAAAGKLLEQLAQRDPAAAFAWYKQNLAGNPKLLSATAASLFGKIAETNPALALDNLWQLSQKDIRDSAAHAIVNQMMANGQKDQLTQYFNAMTDPAAQAMLARAMVDQWATYYPEMTAEWVAGLTDPAVRNRAEMALIFKWGYDNPSKAAQWVTGLARDENWSKEVNQMVSVWARDSPDKAAAWLVSLSPPAAELDPAVRQLAQAVMYNNPEGAMAWANAMYDPSQRHHLMQRVGAIWMQKDPAQASAYIINSDLPDWMKKRLLRTR